MHRPEKKVYNIITCKNSYIQRRSSKLKYNMKEQATPDHNHINHNNIDLRYKIKYLKANQDHAQQKFQILHQVKKLGSNKCMDSLHCLTMHGRNK